MMSNLIVLSSTSSESLKNLHVLMRVEIHLSAISQFTFRYSRITLTEGLRAHTRQIETFHDIICYN